MTAVVLAAGGGRRMGGQKMVAPFRGRPLLAWTLELVQRLPVDQRLVVLGAAHAQVRSTFPLVGWRVAVNECWEEGMSGSLQVAEHEAPAGGLLIFLGDMPCIPEAACRSVIWHACDAPVAPSYNGRRGFPVYLPAHLRPKLHDLRGDRGARTLLRDCCLLPQEDPGVLWDADSAEDLACGTLRD